MRRLVSSHPFVLYIRVNKDASGEAALSPSFSSPSDELSHFKSKIAVLKSITGDDGAYVTVVTGFYIFVRTRCPTVIGIDDSFDLEGTSVWSL